MMQMEHMEDQNFMNNLKTNECNVNRMQKLYNDRSNWLATSPWKFKIKPLS
jgi:hypothetical protein